MTTWLLCHPALQRLSRFKPHLLALALSGSSPILGADLGVFENQADVGKPAKEGNAVFDSATGSYSISGGGENMWFTNDSFHFVWKKVSGDFVLQAAIEFRGATGNAHRKACLMVRQTLAADSPYIDVAVHGDGLTSLQFREAPGGLTHEIQANLLRPPQVGIGRQGEVFFLGLPESKGTSLSPAGPFMRIKLSDPVYVGLGVCSHDDKVTETANFSQVKLAARVAAADQKPVLHSTIEIVPIGSKDRRVVYHTLDHLEAPNWTRDGQSLLFNSGGHIYRLPVKGGTPVVVDTGFANRCNNDHGLSPDGTQLAISDQSRGGKSLIYIVPAAGGTPRQITPVGPSYWHGWSPDGSTLAYCAERNGEFDVYTVPAAGGGEKRLTTAKGLDDGPEYTADGKFIYFNSDRTGTMQIWRMKPDGSDQEQVTSDEFNNWFAHPSPDGKWIVFLSYEKDVSGHPANKEVRLRLMPLGGGPIQDLARLFGGQGTMNVPSWSPDSRQVAFVSYELLQP
jgi:Tol biopolymer transport system component